MEITRESIQEFADASIKKYPHHLHHNLVSFEVPSYVFLKNNNDYVNFSGIIAIVDKEWLFDYINEFDNADHMRSFDLEEYSDNERHDWFEQAVMDNNLAAIYVF